MNVYVKAAVLDNAIEARLIEEVLKDKKIPHIIQSYHDTAYDGMFQSMRGWGIVRAPEEHHEQIKSILIDLRSGIVIDFEDNVE